MDAGKTCWEAHRLMGGRAKSNSQQNATNFGTSLRKRAKVSHEETHRWRKEEIWARYGTGCSSWNPSQLDANKPRLAT